MNSMAQPREKILPHEPARWQTAASWLAAIPLALLFLSSGVWKATEPEGWAMRLAQARVPQLLSAPGAIALGVAETVAGVLLLAPRLRRWGAALTALLLLAFMAWFAIHYAELRGADCSCFPWVQRVVGPGFFAGDAAMLLLAAVAALWAPRPSGRRAVAIICGAVTVFALLSYGVESTREASVRAPAAITVQGRPYSLAHGRFFLFFFNPMCMHCMDAAKRMSRLDWGETQVVAIPVAQPQFARQFLEESGLRAVISTDFGPLARTFGYTTYPFGVVVIDGRERARLTAFDDAEPLAALRRTGLVR